MQALLILEEAYKDFSIDFIIDLPPSKALNSKVCNTILVVVDRLTKHVRYFPVSITINALRLVDLIYREFVLITSAPRSFMLDRDTRFISEY